MDAGTDNCRMDTVMRCKGLRRKSVEGVEDRRNGPSNEIGGFALEQHLFEKKNRHCFCTHGTLTSLTETTPSASARTKRINQHARGHAETKGDKTNHPFPTHSQMSAKQSKVAATYSGAGIRAEAKKSKVVFKNVLDTPFNIPW